MSLASPGPSSRQLAMGLRMTASAVVKPLPEALEPGAVPYQRDGEILKARVVADDHHGRRPVGNPRRSRLSSSAAEAA